MHNIYYLGLSGEHRCPLAYLSVQTVNAIVKRPLVLCLKLCLSMVDPVQAKICELYYEMVYKDYLQMEIPYGVIISTRYRPLNCTFKFFSVKFGPS